MLCEISESIAIEVFGSYPYIWPASPTRNHRTNFDLILVGEHLVFGH